MVLFLKQYVRPLIGEINSFQSEVFQILSMVKVELSYGHNFLLILFKDLLDDHKF